MSLGNAIKTYLLLAIFLMPSLTRAELLVGTHSDSTPNPRWVGWSNLFLPGSGQIIRGNTIEGLSQAGYELSTFAGGYLLSSQQGFSSLDGIDDSFAALKLSKQARNSQDSLEKKMTSDILLEFSIKSHMTNTFIAYRDAYRDRGITEGLDQHTALEGLTIPFEKKYFGEADVWIPLMIVAGAIVADYVTTSPVAVQPLNPASNIMYSFNYGLWQPLGSGYPEEAFFRGFLQHEVTQTTASPFLGIFVQSIAFAFSHEPGNGRYSAAAVGGYLGYLSYRHNGDLGPGTTLHFWGDLLLGVETVLLSLRGQHTTAPAAFSVQFNY